MQLTYTATPTFESRADARRRQVEYLRIPATYGEDFQSNYPFSEMLIASTAKRMLPALRRSIRSKYARHVGAKERAKVRANRSHK